MLKGDGITALAFAAGCYCFPACCVIHSSFIPKTGSVLCHLLVGGWCYWPENSWQSPHEALCGDCFGCQDTYRERIAMLGVREMHEILTGQKFAAVATMSAIWWCFCNRSLENLGTSGTISHNFVTFSSGQESKHPRHSIRQPTVKLWFSAALY